MRSLGRGAVGTSPTPPVQRSPHCASVPPPPKHPDHPPIHLSPILFPDDNRLRCAHPAATGRSLAHCVASHWGAPLPGAASTRLPRLLAALFLGRRYPCRHSRWLSASPPTPPLPPSSLASLLCPLPTLLCLRSCHLHPCGAGHAMAAVRRVQRGQWGDGPPSGRHYPSGSARGFRRCPSNAS